MYHVPTYGFIPFYKTLKSFAIYCNISVLKGKKINGYGLEFLLFIVFFFWHDAICDSCSLLVNSGHYQLTSTVYNIFTRTGDQTWPPHSFMLVSEASVRFFVFLVQLEELHYSSNII